LSSIKSIKAGVSQNNISDLI